MTRETQKTVIPITATERAVEPRKKAGLGLIITFVFAYLGVWIGTLTPVIVSLPIRVRQIDSQNYVANLSVILFAGAIFAMLANPFFGRLSDRTTSRYGMRRPWLIIGAFGGVVGVSMIALIPSIVAVMVGWCLAQIATNVLLAVATAILPDQIPSAQRGKVSGYLSMCISISPVVGAFIVQYFIASSLWMFLTPALVMAIGCLLLAFVLEDRHMDVKDIAPYGIGEFLSSFWINWFKYPDFSWLWLGRFLRIFSFAMLMSFQVYFVTDYLGKSAVEASGVIVLSTLINAAMGVVGANGAGALSDYLKRRKVFVVWGSLIYAGGMFGLAFCNGMNFFYICIAVMGLGQGIFIALEFALVTDVLPEAATNAAKNLGVFNMASALPQAIAPAIAPSILALGSGNNYTALFVVAGLASVAGATLVPFIKGAR